MSLLFSEEDFEEAWKELDERQLDGGWEFFIRAMEVEIYRLHRKDTGLYEYKVFGVLSTCSPELCADVYMDLDYRKQWDGYVKVFMNYYDNPGGMIPTWLINWAARTGVPGFLTDMEKACSNYKNCSQKK